MGSRKNRSLVLDAAVVLVSASGLFRNRVLCVAATVLVPGGALPHLWTRPLRVPQEQEGEGQAG